MAEYEFPLISEETLRTILKEEAEAKQSGKGDETGMENDNDKMDQLQLKNEIAETKEEQIQRVLDLDQITNATENASDTTLSEKATTQQEDPSIKNKEPQISELNLDDVITSPDGLVPPPPTPAATAEGSGVELENDIETNSKEFDTDAEADDTHKPKEAKRAGFKMASLREAASDHGSYDDSKVITGAKNHEREKQQAECNRYSGFENFASTFVEKIIDTSINSVADNKMHTLDEEDSTLSSLRTFVEVFGAFTKWPRIQEFSKQIGENVIEEFVQTWEYDEDWMYCIDFLLAQSDECSEYYHYEVKWSIPSKQYPIPQTTASVYFTIEVSRVKPPYCPVDVSYIFEGSRTVHIPGKVPFQEHWLFSIIDAKLEMYKRLKF